MLRCDFVVTVVDHDPTWRFTSRNAPAMTTIFTTLTPYGGVERHSVFILSGVPTFLSALCPLDDAKVDLSMD